MEVYLFRHGIAEEHSSSGSDRDRKLTPDGIARTRQSAKALRKLGVAPTRVFYSPFVRTRETAQILSENTSEPWTLEPLHELASGAPREELLRALQTISSRFSSIMLVGHEPDLSELISVLLSGQTDLAISVKKGSACKLECGEPEPGRAVLRWLLTSRQLAQMV